MKFVNPSGFEAVMQSQGVPRGEVWKDIDKMEGVSGEKRHNIEELISPEEMFPERIETIRRSRLFCEEVSDSIKENLGNLLRDGSIRGPLSEEIIDFLEKQGLILPELKIAAGLQAEEMLFDFDLPFEQLERDQLIVLFKLPKPLDEFWWKSEENPSFPNRATQNMVVSWGDLYHEIMPVVWGVRGFYEDEMGLNFERVNMVGQHEVGKYYYVWRVRKT